MLRQLLIAGVLLSFTLVAWKAPQNKNKQSATAATANVDYKQIGSAMPPLRLYSKDGKYLTEQDFPTDKNIILMMFNPTCEHCEEQTFHFKDSLAGLPNAKLVLVAGAMMKDYLDFFITNTRLQGRADMPVTLDSCNLIDKAYQYHTLPQINIYDKERKLSKVFFGVTKMDSLKAYLH